MLDHVARPHFEQCSHASGTMSAPLDLEWVISIGVFLCVGIVAKQWNSHSSTVRQNLSTPASKSDSNPISMTNPWGNSRNAY